MITISNDINNITSDNDINNTRMDIVQCEIYVRPRFPKSHISSFFHDLECIVSAFDQINGSISDCTEITMFTKKSYNYSNSAYSSLFNLTIIDDKIFDLEPKSNYGCQRSMKWMSNYHNKIQEFRQFIINKYKLKNKYNINYNSYKFYNLNNNLSDILIIDRHHHRGIANINKLYNKLISIYNINRVHLVYFDDLPITIQFEYILNSSIIITPHGAAETSFIMISNDKLIKSQIKLIELCPPYNHCWFGCDNFKGHRGNLCPHFFSKQFKQHKIIGIGREDFKWNCDNYCQYQKNSKRNFDKEFRRINNFTVSIDLIIDAINNFKNYSNNKWHPVLIKKVKMMDKEFYFYNSTKTVTNGYWDLNTTLKN